MSLLSPLRAHLYPYVLLLDTVGGSHRWPDITKYIAAKSSKRCRPNHVVCVPGSPSLLRPRNPPSEATIRTASRRLGGCAGGWGFWFKYATRAFHSWSSKYTVQGTSGVSRPSLVR